MFATHNYKFLIEMRELKIAQLLEILEELGVKKDSLGTELDDLWHKKGNQDSHPFLDPITFEIMENPVRTEGGTVYDQESINKYFATQQLKYANTNDVPEPYQRIQIQNGVTIVARDVEIKIKAFLTKRIEEELRRPLSSSSSISSSIIASSSQPRSSAVVVDVVPSSTVTGQSSSVLTPSTPDQSNGRIGLSEADLCYCAMAMGGPRSGNISVADTELRPSIIGQSSNDVESNDPGVLHNQGNELFCLFHYEEALRCYTRALAIIPNDLRLIYNRSTVLIILNRNLEALESLNRLLQIRPIDPIILHQSLYQHGFVLYSLGRYSEAVESLNRSLEIHSIGGASTVLTAHDIASVRDAAINKLLRREAGHGNLDEEVRPILELGGNTLALGSLPRIKPDLAKKLLIAVKTGDDRAILHLWVEGAKIEKDTAFTSSGWTALHWAAYGGHVDAVKMLLACFPGHENDLTNSAWFGGIFRFNGKQTPAMLAAIGTGSAAAKKEIVELLRSHGANLALTDVQGQMVQIEGDMVKMKI